jgi:predicted MPP superfamily phosphohydrolase
LNSLAPLLRYSPPTLSRREFLGRLLMPFVGLAAASGVNVARAQDEFPFEIVEQALTLPRLHPAFDGLTIAQMSDLHYDGVGMRSAWLRSVVDEINRREVDVVLLTGDYPVRGDKGFTERIPELSAELARLKAQDAVLAIYGNHDVLHGIDLSREVIERAGHTELVNAVYTLRRDGATLHFAGMDDFNYGQPDMDAVLAAIPDDGAAVCLMHEPDYADISAATGRFDLQISGHSHGGQVRGGDGTPLTLPRNAKHYHSGLYRVRDMVQYTNRGLGTKPPHIRVNCPPELTVFTLYSTGG